MIITPDELKNSVLNANIDSEYIEPAINEAEDVYLREILGDNLYETILDKIDTETLADKYLELVDHYIKPYLTYKVQSLMVVPVNFKLRNAGVIQQYGQDFQTTGVEDTAYMMNYYNGKAEFYANRIERYLEKNFGELPEYTETEDNITNPTTSQTACGIFLGGR